MLLLLFLTHDMSDITHMLGARTSLIPSLI